MTIAVSLAKYRLFYRVLLQKRPMIFADFEPNDYCRLFGVFLQDVLCISNVAVYFIGLLNSLSVIYSHSLCKYSRRDYGLTDYRLFVIIGLFCKRALQKRRYSAKETYNFDYGLNVYQLRGLYTMYTTKLYVSFAEYRLFYRALLQNRPIIFGDYDLNIWMNWLERDYRLFVIPRHF